MRMGLSCTSTRFYFTACPPKLEAKLYAQIEADTVDDRYHAEPSGTFYRYDAKAIGSGSEGAQAELQNEYHRSLTLAEAETLVLKTLKQVMEEKLDAKNVQLASVTKEKGFRIYTDEEMGRAVATLNGNQ